jgi:Putative restriction endonuclease
MTVAVTSAAEGFPRRAFTVEDVGRMIDAGVLGEDEKFELIEGEIVMMAAKELFKKSGTRFAQLDPGEAHLVIEVAATSIAYDKGLKARLYARHRVREIWVIDANERITWVHTGPSGEGWSSSVERGPQDALTTPALPGLSIRLDEIG